MYRPIFACDRCGHWFTTARAFEHNELPYEPEAGHFDDWDLCARCYTSLPEERIEEWFEAGKGCEVKPRVLK